MSISGKNALPLLPLLGLAACMPVSNYHSARTLGDGESSWGMTFSSTTYRDVDEEGNEDEVTIPGMIPEFTYHIGFDGDFEVGGRVAPGFLYGEVDAKYRFLHSEGLHLAIAPAIGQMAVGARVTSLRLPLLATFELSDRLAINASVNGSSWFVGNPGENEDTPFADGDDFLQTAGGSIGLEISGRTAYFRPSIDFTRAVVRQGDAEDEAFEMVQLSLHFGFVSGREDKKLDEIKDQLDRIENKMTSWKYRTKPAESDESATPSS